MREDGCATREKPVSARERKGRDEKRRTLRGKGKLRIDRELERGEKSRGISPLMLWDRCWA